MTRMIFKKRLEDKFVIEHMLGVTMELRLDHKGEVTDIMVVSTFPNGSCFGSVGPARSFFRRLVKEKMVEAA